VLELYGPGNRTHYAIMPRGEVDPPFMHARFQIAVVEYGSNDSVDHGYVPACLEKLRAAVERTDSAPVSWSFGSVEATGAIQRGHPHLDVVRGPLPTARRKGECLVLSAGGKGDDDAFIISDALRPTLSGWRRAGHGPPAPLSPYVARLGGHAFAVRARLLGEDVKALEAVRDASTAVFDAVAPRYRTINMQLLATGGGDGANATRWSARPFPARFSFMETVRAWGEWRRAHDVSDVRLVLYVVDPSVTRELVSGRIDVLELLRCPDIGIWTEQVEGGIVVERRRFQVGDSTILATIVDELCLDPAWWNVEVSPPTSIRSGSGPRPLDGSQGETPLTRSLRSLGVVAGSTLHFRRIEQRASIAPGPAAPPSAITARRRSGRARAGR